jgi:putative transposase
MPIPKPPFLLTVGQLRHLSPYFPLSYGVPRVDDRRVVSGIIYVIRHGLQWRDAPAAYGPYKTLYNRFVRWSPLGVFDRIFAAQVAPHGVARHPNFSRNRAQTFASFGQ